MSGRPRGARRRITLSGGRCVLPDGREARTDVILDAGRIAEIGPVQRGSDGTIVDASGCWVVPGFIDLHAHGGGGASFADATASAASAVLGFHAAHGTTRVVASLVPADLESLRATLGGLRTAAPSGLLGVHLEGPYVSPAQPGALDPAWLRLPDAAEFRALVAGCESFVRVVTIAPELPGASELLSAVRDTGAVAAIGHSAATYEEARAAVDRGAHHVSHLWNAMSGLHHRHPGVVGAALFDPRVTIELIADGLHVHPDVVRFVTETLADRGQRGRLCLVSDAIPAAGLPDGPTRLGDLAVLVRDGAARLPDGTLAGSTTPLDAALRNVVGWTGLPLGQAIPLVTRNPAAVLGATDLGELRPGALADVVLLDSDLRVALTIREGEVVFDRSSSPPI